MVEKPQNNIPFLENKSEEFKTIYFAFKKLFSSKNTNKVLSAFSDLMDIPTAVLDIEGNILSSSGWRKICTDFHRVNTESCQKCLESDTELANQLDIGKGYTIYNCKNGMVDCASPVIIEGHHVANVFVGQFLSKEPDKDFFRSNAKKYGFDEKAYMEALNEVSIIEEEKSQKILNFILEFSKFISSMAMDEIRAMKIEQTHQLELTQKIKEEVEKNRKKDQQLIQQSRLAQMGEVISMLGHQWRQPISAISMVANNMLVSIEFDDLDEHSLKNSAKDIVRMTQKLSNTIDNFRNFYKPNKESVVIKLEDVIEKALNIIKLTLISNNINIIEEYNSDEEIELYDSEVMHVILNILRNALEIFQAKETKNQKIIIKTKNRTISIFNNGEKISEDIIDNIFDPYFSTKEERNGAGLGLYMSKTIIQNNHNGKLSVKNIDDGVCFTIEFGTITSP